MFFISNKYEKNIPSLIIFNEFTNIKSNYFARTYFYWIKSIKADRKR